MGRDLSIDCTVSLSGTSLRGLLISLKASPLSRTCGESSSDDELGVSHVQDEGQRGKDTIFNQDLEGQARH